jgi:ABC-type hemin transport system substrate-binding protein
VSTSRATVTSLATISRRAILASGAMLALGACRRLAPSAARGERVVVLSPALAATLKDLGVSDLVVGRHGWDMALDPGLPVCGDQSGIDYEALLAAHPTVVIIELNPRDVPDRLVELARTNGWELLNLPALGLDDVVRVTRTLEDRFSPGAGLADRLAGLSGGAGGLARAGRVMLIAGEQPIAALGPGSVHHDLLVRLGAEPAVREGGPYQELDAEDMVTLAPECAVVLLPRSPGSASGPALTSAEIAARPGLALLRNTPAAERGRLAIIDDPLCLTPSTSLLRVASELEGILRRWAE